LSESLDGVNRELLYPAVKAVLENQDGAARGSLSKIYPKLDDRDIAALLPFIVKAIKEPSPSGEMFADGIRLAGLDLLSRLRVREGMTLCVELIEPERWGLANRLPRCLEYLTRYGRDAAPLVPRLREIRDAVRKKPEQVAALDKAIAKIEAGQRLISTLALLRGSLPPRAMALTIEWALQHQPELMRQWQRARRQQPLQSIPPLA
jgi:hypothetical protein